MVLTIMGSVSSSFRSGDWQHGSGVDLVYGTGIMHTCVECKSVYDYTVKNYDDWIKEGGIPPAMDPDS